jgi:hypothetical protein
LPTLRETKSNLPEREERHDRRPVDDPVVDLRPELIVEVRIRRLQHQRSSDRSVDSWIAEPGPVLVGRASRFERVAGEVGVEVGGCRGVVGQERDEPGLDTQSRARRPRGAEVDAGIDVLQPNVVAEAAEELRDEEGLILHLAGRTDEGFRIIDVWESREARERFDSGRPRLRAEATSRELDVEHVLRPE